MGVQWPSHVHMVSLFSVPPLASSFSLSAPPLTMPQIAFKHFVFSLISPPFTCYFPLCLLPQVLVLELNFFFPRVAHCFEKKNQR